MLFSTDDASTTGHMHLSKGEGCQDYALSGTDEHGAYAVVSDGCSSGKRTDIGARLVCLAARPRLDYQHEADVAAFHKYLKNSLDTFGDYLELDEADLLATCLYVRAKQDRVTVSVIGDGVVVVDFVSGRREAYKFEWSNNTPLYPVYGPGEIAILTAKASSLSVERGALDTGSTWSGETQRFPLAEYRLGSFLSFPTALVSRVAIFTDGVMQVPGMEWQGVVEKLLAFRAMAGQFAKRRLNAFLRSVGNSKPEDDLTYAVIDIRSADE